MRPFTMGRAVRVLGAITLVMGAAGAAGAAPPQPCTLITLAEVEAVLGKGATMTAQHNPRLGIDECHIKRAGADLEEIVVTVRHIDKTQWDLMKAALFKQAPASKPEPGLGDDAYSGATGGYNVLKGSAWMQLFNTRGDDAKGAAQVMRSLAQQAASRL